MGGRGYNYLVLFKWERGLSYERHVEPFEVRVFKSENTVNKSISLCNQCRIAGLDTPEGLERFVDRAHNFHYHWNVGIL